MSIKSDHWIRRMSENEDMISPFERGQVRENDGQRVISYGTSSYGYDVRCSNKFKIFTNVHSTTVDPKNFDENSSISGEFLLNFITYIFEILSNIKIKTGTNKLILKNFFILSKIILCVLDKSFSSMLL